MVMRSFQNLLNWIKNALNPPKPHTEKEQKLYPTGKQIEEIHSIWDHIKFVEQSQAHHICNILGFEEWTDMEEILRRIKEVFGAEYKNERSLYPYIKTLVDCGLIESSAFGGKRKWRKKEVLIKIKTKQIIEEEEQTMTTQA